MPTVGDFIDVVTEDGDASFEVIYLLSEQRVVVLDDAAYPWLADYDGEVWSLIY